MLYKTAHSESGSQHWLCSFNKCLRISKNIKSVYWPHLSCFSLILHFVSGAARKSHFHLRETRNLRPWFLVCISYKLEFSGCLRDRPMVESGQWKNTWLKVTILRSTVLHIRIHKRPSTMYAILPLHPTWLSHLVLQLSSWPRLLCPAWCLSLTTCADHHRHTELGKSSKRKKYPPGCSCHNTLTKPPLTQSDIQVNHWES
jgi:hypothetical protein